MTLKEWRKNQKEKGLCVHCASPVEPGHTLCAKHLQKVRECTLKAKDKRAEENRCRCCGRPLQEEELGIYKTCAFCRSWHERRGFWN